MFPEPEVYVEQQTQQQQQQSSASESVEEKPAEKIAPKAAAALQSDLEVEILKVPYSMNEFDDANAMVVAAKVLYIFT